jgi:hypothetical protein
MTKEQEFEFAERESARMRILASQYRQMGFRALALWLDRNADRALKWIAKTATKDNS